ncbi:PTS fructose transporter subunit IIC [Lactobacillus kimbladii]|uniref:PTS fructose transporter subunit IIC n=1 Tax=Lactobacillus kimbladii TaxID=1218506 RepID=UPI003AF691FF
MNTFVTGAKKAGSAVKKHLLTSISYMLPLVVASGLLIAIGNLMGGKQVTSLTQMNFPNSMTTLGVLGMGLLPSFIAGYIGYSIADRPGIAPGFLAGQIASFLGAGFLGGIIGGFIAGYIALGIRKIKVPRWANGLMPMLIVPTVTAIFTALIMFFLLGQPLTAATTALNHFITNLDRSPRALYGFLIGWIGCLDYGGAISKIPNLICDGLLLDGIKGPEGIKVLASMVPPFGVTMSYFLAKLFHKNIYTRKEIENIEVAFPMGCCMITEGVIPIAMNDLFRTLPCTWIGCGVTGMISYALGNESPVPSGGIFVIPAMSKPVIAIIALLVGSLITGILLAIIKKPLTEKQIDEVQEDDEKNVDLSNINIQ